MQFKNTRWWWASFLSLSLFACKKETDEIQAPPPPPSQPAQASLADLQKDSALLISRDIYLWHDQIPQDFNPRSHSTLGDVMTALRQFSKEPGFDKPVDRWSFAIEQKRWDNISSGVAGDFGITVFFMKENDLRVRSVEPLSPAGRAGIRRGWRISALNGNTNISTTNRDLVVNAVYQSSNTNFTFEKPDGTSASVALNAATYKEQPVLLDSVYSVGGKKIGYLVFNSFLGDTTEIYNHFQQAFSRFSQEQVSDLVVDLRYNGGGYISVQNKLAGYLLPSSANGDVLMQQQYNAKYSRYNSTVRVNKQGSLNLRRIFFVVSKNTASAGELIINNLKPYLDVKLIGPSDTYGKPVGYFNIPVGNSYVFPVSSRSTNKNGSGNYFNGFAVDTKVADGLDKDWGDLQENCLNRAVSFITTGSFTSRILGRTDVPVYTEPSMQVKEANNRFTRDDFRGMVEKPKQ